MIRGHGRYICGDEIRNELVLGALVLLLGLCDGAFQPAVYARTGKVLWLGMGTSLLPVGRVVVGCSVHGRARARAREREGVRERRRVRRTRRRRTRRRRVGECAVCSAVGCGC